MSADWENAKRSQERTWIFPWDVEADTPEDGLLCNECLTGGEGLTTWVEYHKTVDPETGKATITEDHVLTLHGRCMTQSVTTYEDEIAARRAAKQ